MKVTVDWLREYVDVPETADELADALIFSGTNVEEVAPVGGEDVLDLEITTNMLVRSARFARNTSTTPENGSSRSSSWASAASPSIPLRKSTGRVAT